MGPRFTWALKVLHRGIATQFATQEGEVTLHELRLLQTMESLINEAFRGHEVVVAVIVTKTIPDFANDASITVNPARLS